MDLCNIDDIIKSMKNEKLQGVKTISRYDGITLEITKNKKYNIDTVKATITEFGKKYKLLPISFSVRHDDENIFAVQFPQLDVKYTEDQIKASYISSFNFLIQDAISQIPNITKKDLLDRKNIYVRHAILIYCRNNINQYRKTFKDFISDPKYVQDKMNLFKEFISNLDTLK